MRRLLTRFDSTPERMLTPGSPSNRLLLLGLGILAFLASAQTLVDLIRFYPWSADLEIPLSAASRWMAGGQAYVPSAFRIETGYDLPFLYPPYALPLFAPLTLLPRDLLHAAWFIGGLSIAWMTCRRLGFQHRWIPFVLAWPPFAEGLISGNIQIATFAAFVFLFVPRHGRSVKPGVVAERSTRARGLLAAATAFLKPSQAHALVYLVRREWRRAGVAVGLIATLILLTLPLTGLTIWADWVRQIQLASDPAWRAGGPSIAQYLPAPIPTLVVAGSLAATIFIPWREAAAWVGLLLVIGSPTMHTYYLLLLLPSMLRLRWEIGLIAALLIGFQVEAGWWAALIAVFSAMLFSLRFDRLLQPSVVQIDGPLAGQDLV